MKGSLYNHPRIITLILLLIIFSGLNAFYTMPRLEDPHMENRLVKVTTYYPGADAERVEAEVTEKLERKMREVSAVKNIISVSQPDISVIHVELADRVTSAKPITARLRDKVADVTDLPPGAGKPDFSDTSLYPHTAIIALTWQSKSPINYAILGRHAQELESRIRNLFGTDFVDILGLPDEEIRITVNDTTLAAHGLTMAEVAARIKGSDARSSAGVINTLKDRMVIQVYGALDSLKRIRNIPIGYDEAGASLRIGDVAHVERTYETPPSRLAYINGSYGVSIAARMLENQRIDRWSDDLAVMLNEYKSSLPNSIHLDTIYDQRLYADENLGGLMGNLAVGALVVVTVLLLSLGWRASFVAASILPLTLLASLAITQMFGLRFERILVIGLIVALGIMVDNAIVVTDEIQQLRLKGERRSTAVAKTIHKLWLPLLGSTLTTIIAFMPLVLMNGAAGEYLVGVPAAVIASLAASYVIAFTIISAVAGKVVQGRKPGEAGTVKRLWWRDGMNGAFISRPFRKSLELSIAHPVKSLILAAALPLFGFGIASTIPDQFFPNSDRNQFLIKLNMPGQASIEETTKAVELLDYHIRSLDAVTETHWYIGSRPAKYYFSMLTTTDGMPSAARGVVTTTNYNDVPRIVPQLQKSLTDIIPEALIIVQEFSGGPPVEAPIEIRVAGPNLAVLETIGNDIRTMLSQLPDVTYTQMTLTAGRPMISVVPREDDVSVTGLSLSDVESQLNALTRGTTVSYVIEETQQVPVKLISHRNDRNSLASIADMNIMGTLKLEEADGSYADVPISAIADVRLASKVGSIAHRNGERTNTVKAYVRSGALPAVTLDIMQQKLTSADFALPLGYKLTIGGESEQRSEALTNLFGAAGMLGVMMLLCVVLTFNSYRLAYVTLASASLAAGLGFFSLWLFGFPLSFVVIFGLMGLIGLAINAAIVMLSELRGIPAARDGDHQAIVEGIMNTGRHILSTTLTTVGGFLPLIVSGGPFWPPFAIAVAGGAFLSMVVTFYFAPAAFAWMTKKRPFKSPSGQTAHAPRSA